MCVYGAGLIDCALMMNCRRKAIKATANLFGAGMGNGHNNPADAFRHCYWSCCMAQTLFSPNGARGFGYSHEAFPQNPKCERDMDWHNNQVGRNFGYANPKTDCAVLCDLRYLQLTPIGPCNPIGKGYRDGGCDYY